MKFGGFAGHGFLQEQRYHLCALGSFS